jgi:hypothetical protein
MSSLRRLIGIGKGEIKGKSWEEENKNKELDGGLAVGGRFFWAKGR